MNANALAPLGLALRVAGLSGSPGGAALINGLVLAAGDPQASPPRLRGQSAAGATVNAEVSAADSQNAIISGATTPA